MNLTNRYIFLNSYSLLKNPQKWSTKYSYLTWGELSNPNRRSSFAVWLCTSAMMTSKLFVLDWLVQSFCQQSAALTSFGELPPPSQTAEVLVAACVVHACERFFLQKNFFYKFSQLIEQILFCFVCMYVTQIMGLGGFQTIRLFREPGFLDFLDDYYIIGEKVVSPQEKFPHLPPEGTRKTF